VIRVLLADDEPLARDGLRAVLGTQPDLEVIAEAADGRTAVDAASELEPDVAIVDIRMPRMDGLAATEEIVRRCPRTRVLILTTFDLDENVYLALRAGAAGFLLKDATRDQLVQAVRAVAAGETPLSPRLTRRLIEHWVRRPPKRSSAPPGLDDLTEREREVFALVARGLTNAEIARQLGIGEGTVKTHVAHLLMKLELRDRTQAVILAYEAGLEPSVDRGG
jgi:DNA-binding NarL/FixJ family response regulator